MMTNDDCDSDADYDNFEDDLHCKLLWYYYKMVLWRGGFEFL